MQKKILQMSIQEIYLDWVNNFLTVEYMAEYYNVSPKVLQTIIEATKEIINNNK